MDRADAKNRVKAALPVALVGAFAGAAGVVGSYAAAGFTPEFVVAPVESFLARSMPGAVITFAITVLGNLGQKLSLASAVGLSAGTIGAFAVAGIALGRRLDSRAVPVAVPVVGGWGLATVLTGAPVLGLAAGLPAGGVVLLAETIPSLDVAGGISEGRRQVVGTGASVLAFGGIGYLVGTGRSSGPERSLSSTDAGEGVPTLGGGGGRETAAAPSRTDAPDSPGSTPTDGEPAETPEDGTETDPESTSTSTPSRSQRRQQLLARAERQSLDVEGLEPLVSGEDFYNVDINAVDPDLDASAWSLSVTGAVEEEVTIDYEELRAMPSEDRFVTLRCVGERLNGEKMDNALWTGVPVMDLVEQASPQSGCECVMLRAADDYYEEFPLAAMEDGLLAFGMDDRVLPRSHGFPVRALIPGHWGEINVKWLDEIEILNQEAQGYWEERGWHGTGPVNTVAKLHAVNELDDGRRQVGGHTYAGTRGIQQVEVSTDGGSTWNVATLSEPLPGDDVWRQWAYTYDPPDGSHEVVVRATDGTGTLQPQEESGAFPSGPTGWVSRTVG